MSISSQRATSYLAVSKQEGLELLQSISWLDPIYHHLFWHNSLKWLNVSVKHHYWYWRDFSLGQGQRRCFTTFHKILFISFEFRYSGAQINIQWMDCLHQAINKSNSHKQKHLNGPWLCGTINQRVPSFAFTMSSKKKKKMITSYSDAAGLHCSLPLAVLGGMCCGRGPKQSASPSVG